MRSFEHALPCMVMLASCTAACSSDSFTNTTPDGGAADSATEATSEAGNNDPCDLGKPFGIPSAVAGLSDPTIFEGDPRLSPDELTVFFERPSQGDAGLGGSDLWVATRSSRTDPFGPAVPVVGVNTAEDEVYPAPSNDLKTLFFSAVRGSVKMQIYVATRQTTAASFSSPTWVNLGPTTVSYATPFLDDPRQDLYFDRLAPPTNDDIYRARINGGGVGAPAAVDEINSDASDLSPVVTSDGLRIFWTSNRADLGSKGDYDIWTASRATTSAKFGPVTNVAELNSAKLESPSWVSADGCRIYLSSNRTGNNRDVYMAERPK